MEAFASGSKVVFLDAPTGAGKTLIGELVRRQLDTPTLYVCTTKSLQDQFVEDFRYATILKGRANYKPNADVTGYYTCEDCTGSACALCDPVESCPYKCAKALARGSRLATVNTAYLLAEAHGGGGEISKNRGLMVMDEADLLEGALMNFVEVSISGRAQEKYGIKPPEKKTVRDAWVEWVTKTLPRVKALAHRSEGRAKEQESRQALKEARYLSNLHTRLARMESDLEQGRDWVYTDYNRGNIVFKPVHVDHLAKDYLWKLSPRFLLMSASIISAEQMAEDLGVEHDEWSLVTVDAQFPVENRPVHVMGMGEMTHKNLDANMDKLVKAVSAILDAHADERVLVHTVSYKLAVSLTKRLGKYTGRIVTYFKASKRDEALARFKAKSNGVLVAASMDRGIDLPDDLCRVQVIAKVPYPSLGDKQVAQRLHSKGGQQWYQVQTVRTLVQMTGRGVRHDQDHAVTYILDSKFLDLHRRAKGLFPGWWDDAIDWSGSKRRELM